MSSIAMLLDVEEGHFLATFRLAKELRARGHHVVYLGLGSAEGLVRQQGFDFVPILGETLTGTRTANVASASPALSLEQALVNGTLDGALARLKPDALVLLSLFYLEALLIERRYRIPIVLLTPHYRPDRRLRAIEKGITRRLMEMRSDVAQEVLAQASGGDARLRSFRDVAGLLLPIPELILLPKAFDLPELAADPHVTYVGAGVDLGRAEEPFPWEAVDSRLPLVYCSLGSQADIAAGTARRFFLAVMEAAAARPDLQFVLSVGRGLSLAELPAPTPNLYLGNWIPQMRVLERASLMVNHAGVGTVKECIVRGVPMVVLPLMRDQFDCARRVVHHGLGIEGDLKGLAAEGLLALVDAVLGDPAFRQRVGIMRERFLETEGIRAGVCQVEEAIARGAAPTFARREEAASRSSAA